MHIYNFMVETKNRQWQRAMREQSFVLKPKEKNKLVTWPQQFGTLNQDPEKKLRILTNVLARLEGEKKSVKYEIPDIDFKSITEYVGQNQAHIYNQLLKIRVKGDDGKEISDLANFSTLSGKEWRDFLKLCDFNQTHNVFTLGEII